MYQWHFSFFKANFLKIMWKLFNRRADFCLQKIKPPIQKTDGFITRQKQIY